MFSLGTRPSGVSLGSASFIFFSGFCAMITGKRKPDRHRNDLAKTTELPSIFLEIPNIFLESPGIFIVFLIFFSSS